MIGHSHERDEVRVFRLSRIRGKVSYATKAEHDFTAPEDFDRRDYAQRADWQMGEIKGTAKVFLRERIAWLVERDFGRHGNLRKPVRGDGVKGRGMVFETEYASAAPADLLGALLARERPPARSARARRRGRRAPRAAARPPPRRSSTSPRRCSRPLAEGSARRNGGSRGSNGRSESVIRPERFARLVTLAGLLIGAAREEGSLPTEQVLDELNISLDELREDLDVLNVVNFGGGTYVLYAEIVGDRIEVDPDTYGDNFARPARLLPLEAKALVAAIDLFGDHLPQSGLQSARAEDRRRARPRPLGGGPRDRARPRRLLGRRAPSTRRSSATGCSSSSTTRRTRTTSSSARSSPTSWSRARRAGTSAASTSAAPTPATSASTG